MVQVIGQTNAINCIDMLETTPKFIIVSGDKGSGKSHIIDYLCDTKLHVSPEYVTNMEDVKTLCESVVTYTSNKVFVLSDYDSLNYKVKESILKLCEDVPPHLYIIIETCNISGVLDTLVNRAFVINLSPYSESELREYCNTFLSQYELTDSDITRLICMCRTPGLIKLVCDTGIESVHSMVNKVIGYICKANIANCMKIVNSLKTKTDADGIDMFIFFTAILNTISNNLTTCVNYDLDEYSSIVKATHNALKLLNNKTYNKVMVFDNWLFEIRGV